MFSLTHRTGRAIGFRFIGSVLNVVLSLAIGIILARILPPEEFGLFGITISFIAIAEMVGSCGMLRALVQLKNYTPEHEAAAAIFQFGGIGLMSCLLFFGAPIAAQWFELPRLELIMRLQVGILLLNAGALLPESRLTRLLAFDRLTAVQVIHHVMEGVITIIFALHGLGAVALAIGSLTAAVVRTSVLWMCAPGLVPIIFRSRHLRELTGYGSGILLLSISDTLSRRLDVFIIGRQVGIEAVGLYQRAYQLVTMPLQHVTGPVHKVLFPAMSLIQEEKKRFQRGYLKAVRLSALIAFPLLTALGTSADIIIPFVYGSTWEGTVPILQVLVVSGVFSILSNTQGLVAQASGRPMAEAAFQAMRLILIVIFGFLGSKIGVLGVAVGVSLARFIFCICMTHLAHSITGIRLVDWLKSMRTGIIGCIIMGISILLVKNFFEDYLSRLTNISIVALFGLLVYISTVRFCLSHEDNELLVSICDILPSPLGHMIRLVFGATERRMIQGELGDAL